MSIPNNPLPHEKSMTDIAPILIGAQDVLIAVDVQPDFMPGGALPVAEGDQVGAPIERLAREVFRLAVATQDWHPKDHVSFAINHEGKAEGDVVTLPAGIEQRLWPAHCVQGTPGAQLAIDERPFAMLLRKGFNSGVDSYSGFCENDGQTETGLKGWLANRAAKRVFVAGLATDFCVAATALHALEAGFETFLIEDACRGVAIPLGDGRTTVDVAIEKMLAAGVTLVQSSQLQRGT